jgi:hypothetical protein
MRKPRFEIIIFEPKAHFLFFFTTTMLSGTIAKNVGSHSNIMIEFYSIKNSAYSWKLFH